jgi:hypothetical protein
MAPASIAWVIRCLAPALFFLGALTADGATSFFNVLNGKITELVPAVMPKREIADREFPNRHTIEFVSVSINQRGQMAYLGSP